MSAARDLRSDASGSSTCSSPVAVTHGEIYWNGVWKSREDAQWLRVEFAHQAAQADWYAPTAQQHADALTEALRLTERVDA
jgi:hypothetical protein